jgi:hypothetical protein
MSNNLDTPIDELPIGIRVYNCLKNQNIATVGDLLQRTEDDLLRTPNFAGVSLRELKSVLDSMGLELPRTPPPVPGPTSSGNLPSYIVKEIDRATAQFRNKRVGIETRRWAQRQSKEQRERRKKTGSEQSIAIAEKRAMYLERDRIIVLLREAGQTFRWIGKLLSISSARASQIYFVTKRRQARLNMSPEARDANRR